MIELVPQSVKVLKYLNRRTWKRYVARFRKAMPLLDDADQYFMAPVVILDPLVTQTSLQEFPDLIISRYIPFTNR